MSLAIEQRPERLSLSVACQALGLNRSSVYHRRRGLAGDEAKRCRKKAPQPRALRSDRTYATHCVSEEYRNQLPAEVQERLLEQGEAAC